MRIETQTLNGIDARRRTNDDDLQIKCYLLPNSRIANSQKSFDRIFLDCVKKGLIQLPIYSIMSSASAIKAIKYSIDNRNFDEALKLLEELVR